jgi:hypothetical protein
MCLLFVPSCTSQSAIVKTTQLSHAGILHCCFHSQECQLEDYDPSLAVIADYSTIVIQYGYVTLFVAACPVVSDFCLLTRMRALCAAFACLSR